MGAKDLREAFNSISQPIYNCTMALLDYERAHDVEWQVLTFRGKDQTGVDFAITSGRLQPGVDVNQAARDTAERLLQQGKPQP